MLLGIPWTTCEFGLTHKVFGNPYKPKKPGIAFFDLIYSSAILSNSNVVIPSFISLAISPRVFDTKRALSRIFFISSIFFTIPIDLF